MNKCIKCGKKKATKVGKPNPRGEEKLQRMRCDFCGQLRFQVIKPRKAKKEINDGSNSDNQSSDN